MCYNTANILKERTHRPCCIILNALCGPTSVSAECAAVAAAGKDRTYGIRIRHIEKIKDRKEKRK